MREGKKHPFAINVWRWGLLILLLVLWEIGARLKWIDPFFFSSPLEIARTAVIKWQGGHALARHCLYGRINAPRLRAGNGHRVDRRLLFWFSRPVAQVAEPWLIVLNALPKLALAPVLVIWFGIGFLSKVILAFLMTVVVAAMSAYSGVRTADPALETLMVSLGAAADADFHPPDCPVRHAEHHHRPAGQHRAGDGGVDCRRVYCIRPRAGAYDCLCRHDV